MNYLIVKPQILLKIKKIAEGISFSYKIIVDKTLQLVNFENLLCNSPESWFINNSKLQAFLFLQLQTVLFQIIY
jgi:hypothetical protein